MKFGRIAFQLLTCYFLFSFLSLHTQVNPGSNVLDHAGQKEESPASADPPPTLVSGKTQEIEIDGNDSIQEKSGHYKAFRYGTVSDGSVSIEVFGKGMQWFVRITDRDEALLGESSGGSDQQREAVSVLIKAGDAIRIAVGGLRTEDRGKLEITLIETNRSEGLKLVKETIKKAQALKLKSEQAWNADNPEDARELIREALNVMDQYSGCMQSPEAIDFIKKEIGGFAYSFIRDYETAERAWVLVEQYLEDTIPRNHRDLQATRMNIAATFLGRSKHLEAKQILEKVVELSKENQRIESSILPDASLNLGIVYEILGDLKKARELYDQAIEGFKHKRNDPNRETKLQTARYHQGIILLKFGNFAKAQRIFEDTLRVYEEKLHQDHPNIQIVKQQIAIVLKNSGFPNKALPLFEGVLEVYKRKLSEDDQGLQLARMNLAATMCSLGNIEGARALYEKVLDVYHQSLPADHPRIQNAMRGIASTMFESGDYEGAKAILEDILEVYERLSLSEDHDDLLSLRLIYGSTLYELEEFEKAEEIFKEIIPIYEQDYQPDYPNLQYTRINLGLTFWKLGKLENARDLFEKALSIFEDTLPSDHPEIQNAKWNLAIIDWELEDLQSTKRAFEDILSSLVTALPIGHPDLQAVRGNLAYCLLTLGVRKEAIDLIRKALTETLLFISRIILTGAVREIDESVNNCRWILDRFLSLGYDGAFSQADCFAAAEAFKAAGTRVGITRKTIIAEGKETVEKLREDYFQACEKVASSENEDFNQAWRHRDKSGRALAKAIKRLPGSGKISLNCKPEQIASALPEGWVGISYLRYEHDIFPVKEGETEIISSPNYLAFILHRDGRVNFLNLGNADKIEQFVKSWKKELEEGTAELNSEAAREIKKRIWDPVIRKANKCTNFLIAPDFVLATIPFEALPEGSGVLNDKYTFAYIESLSNLTIDRNDEYDDESCLLIFGGIKYDEEPVLYTKNESNKTHDKSPELPVILNDGFSSAPRSNNDSLSNYLKGTETEAKAIEEIYRAVFKKDAMYLKGAEASKLSLVHLAPRCRYLHIATHGYFAEEYVKSSLDQRREYDEVSLSTMKSRVRSLTPSVLCGIKLAGSNRPRKGLTDEGVITAEEIQALDLIQCELAVLSACETGLGIARSGQGIMSFQRALTIAGARGSITSLWKVEDYATWLLFTEFYRLMWQDNLRPTEALRRAKCWLRDLKIGEIEAWTGQSMSTIIRGLNPPESFKKLPRSFKPYEKPFYWASFVYWGSVE